MNVLRRKWQGLPRGVVVCITALVIYVPLLFIVVQSFLSAPFFSRSKSWSLEAFAFIFTDPDFYLALRSGFILAFGLVIIAIPLGGILAFLMVRTDLPGRRIIEPLILVPIFVSPMVLGFGYVVAAGPVGFFSQWAQQLIGFVPWNIYSMFSIVVIAGLTHVPHAYLYISSALRSVGSDVEEAARTVGATPLQVMTSVSLPMVRPSILYACVLLFFLGLEVFGLMLVLGDPEGNMVLATYLYKLTNKLGTPSYHLMAAVAVVLICITIPLVMLQRRLMRTANRFVTMKGKASQARALPLGKWRWLAGAVVVAWLTVTIGVPLLGVALRAFISNWGVGVSLWDELSLATFHNIWQQPNLLRAIVNSMAIGIIGGALAVICYLFVGIAMHRKADNVTRFLDYSVLVPRAVPGLLAGLAFLWVFLFVPMWLDQSLKHGWLSALPVADWLREHLIVQLRALRNTIFSVWLAYTVVWMAYGLRLISSTLLQVGPELEEAARSTGASRGQITRHVTVPLSRYGLIGSWLLMFLIFEREYSTGVYLLSPGTETIGSMLVSLWAAGAIGRALVYNPPVILLDEPLSNLDAKLREEARVFLRELIIKLGLSALMVTHDQNEAMAISDRILLLNNGVIEQQGTPQEMYGSPATLFAAEFMGSNNRLHGKVMALENGRARIEGASWSLWGRAGEGVSVGEPATAVIRVERLRLDGAAQDNSLQLPLLTSMYLGDRWEYLFRTEGDDFPLRAYGTALRDAEHCHLTLPAEDVWIFPQR